MSSGTTYDCKYLKKISWKILKQKFQINIKDNNSNSTSVLLILHATVAAESRCVLKTRENLLVKFPSLKKTVVRMINLINHGCKNGCKIYMDIMTGKNCRQLRLLTWTSFIYQFVNPIKRRGEGGGMEVIVILASYKFHFLEYMIFWCIIQVMINPLFLILYKIWRLLLLNERLARGFVIN